MIRESTENMLIKYLPNPSSIYSALVISQMVIIPTQNNWVLSGKNGIIAKYVPIPILSVPLTCCLDNRKYDLFLK